VLQWECNAHVLKRDVTTRQIVLKILTGIQVETMHEQIPVLVIMMVTIFA
jgi:hypothetical protein